MPRSIWRGAISFGMVAIPIKLYPATQGKDIRFVTLHNSCHTRMRQRRWCEYHEEFVEFGDTVKGYEYAKDQFVVMEPDDFQGLPVPSIHTIEIKRFVDLADIDPIHFEKSYYLEPDAVGQKPFLLLTRALKESNRVAVAKVAMRQKEHLCSLRPYGSGIVMATMLQPDEIRSTGELGDPGRRVAGQRAGARDGHDADRPPVRRVRRERVPGRVQGGAREGDRGEARFGRAGDPGRRAAAAEDGRPDGRAESQPGGDAGSLKSGRYSCRTALRQAQGERASAQRPQWKRRRWAMISIITLQSISL